MALDGSIGTLEEDIVRLAGDLERRMARWLALVGEFDRLGGARRWGFTGTAEWLAWRCAIGLRAARDHVRVARRLPALPCIGQAFAAGELSYSKVRALTRAAESEDEQALLALARTSTAAQLERAVRAMRSAPSADVEVANAVHDRRFLEWWWEPDGALRIAGRLSADDGAALIEAVELAAEALHGGGPALSAVPDGAPRRPPRGARRADALVEMSISGSPTAQVVLHVDPAALSCTASEADARAGDVCALEDGPAIPSETARRLACDAEVQPVRAVGGDRLLDHGRKRRVVSPPLRASLQRRDGGCRFPGCARRHGLHAHHIRHWAFGGPTDRDNLVLLCRFHHRLVHEDGFTVAWADSGTLAFHRPDGRRVGALPDLRPPPERVAA